MVYRRLFRAKCIGLLLLALAPGAQAAPGPSLLRPFVSLGVSAGYGSGGAKDETIIASLPLLPLCIAGTLGLRMGPFLLGGVAEYQSWLQNADPLQHGNSNLAGNQMSFGPAAGLRFGPVSLLGKYFLVSSYKFKKPDSAGRSVEYYQPATAYAVELRLRSGFFTYFGVEYASYLYREEKRGGAKSSLTSAEEMQFQAVRAIYGITF